MIPLSFRCTRKYAQTIRHIGTTLERLSIIHFDFLNQISGQGQGQLNTVIRNKTIFVELSNPAKKNAISGTIMKQLCRLVDELTHGTLFTDTNFLIFSGSPEAGTFCSGADLELSRSRGRMVRR